jgi:hypothetical protein
MGGLVLLQRVRRRLLRDAGRLANALRLLVQRTLSPLVVPLAGAVLLHKTRSPSPERRARPLLLILRYKYYSDNAAQPSTEELHLDNTLEASGLAAAEILTYDRDFSSWPACDWQLIARCRDTRPDAIVLSSWWWDAPRHPSSRCLRFIRDKLRIPIAAIWWDTCNEAFWKKVQPLPDWIDAHVVVDNPKLTYADTADPRFERVLQLWPPQDESLYHPGSARDIPLSFLGQVSAFRSYRREVVDHLIEERISGHFSTRERDEQVTHAEYAALMRRSKMSLNFSYSVSTHQLKSRVLEVLFSGALLLESENDQTRRLFTPMKDYVPFSSKEDLVTKIGYYLSNEHELQAIARQGRASAIEKYRSERFWRLLLGKIGLIESD